jgi:DNA polymerase IIIc chi subunit
MHVAVKLTAFLWLSLQEEHLCLHHFFSVTCHLGEIMWDKITLVIVHADSETQQLFVNKRVWTEAMIL